MTPKSFSAEDLMLYSMQLLSPEESAEIVTHLEHNDAARKEVAQVQGDLALVALASDMHSPPALARERLLRRVAKEKKMVPEAYAPGADIAFSRYAAAPGSSATADPVLFPRGRNRLLQMEEEAPRRRNSWFAWSGWAVAAGLAVYAGTAYQHDRAVREAAQTDDAHVQQLTLRAQRADAVMAALQNPAALEVALHEPSTGAPVPPTPEAHAAYVAETGSLVFVASHLAPLQAYKTYELWVIPSDGRDPVPAGTFKPDERGYASVILPELPKGIPAKTFGVTIEDDGGAKSPTPPIVLAGM